MRSTRRLPQRRVSLSRRLFTTTSRATRRTWCWGKDGTSRRNAWRPPPKRRSRSITRSATARSGRRCGWLVAAGARRRRPRRALRWARRERTASHSRACRPTHGTARRRHDHDSSACSSRRGAARTGTRRPRPSPSASRAPRGSPPPPIRPAVAARTARRHHPGIARDGRPPVQRATRLQHTHSAQRSVALSAECTL